MKAELTFPEELVDQIADRVIERMLPLLKPDSQAGADEILTINEAASFLKTTSGQIYQWVSNSKHGLGTFPYLKSGKQLRFSKDALIQWMKSNK